MVAPFADRVQPPKRRRNLAGSLTGGTAETQEIDVASLPYENAGPSGLPFDDRRSAGTKPQKPKR